MDVDEPLKRIANPKNIVDRIEELKYSIPPGASQYVNKIEQLSKIVGEQTVETVNLQGQGNMPAHQVNVDWWLPLSLANDDVTSIHALTYDGSEYVYVGGLFNKIGGVDALNIARYSLITRNWEEVGGGVNNDVHAIAIDSTGGVFIGGEFTDPSGVSAASYLATLSGSAWTNVVGSALNNIVYSIEFDSTGSMYVGGDFTNAGGDANADRIFRWDGSVNAMGTGLSNSVKAIKPDPNSTNVYVGGAFTDAGGVAEADFLAKWNGSAFVAVSTDFTLGNTVQAINLDTAGNLYVGGNFASVGGVRSTNFLFKWDGATVSALGNGVAVGGVVVNDIKISIENKIYVGGEFTSASGVDNTQNIAYFSAGVWNSLSNGGGVDTTDNTDTVESILILDSGSVIAGGTFTTAGAVVCKSIAALCKPLNEAIDILASLFELYSNFNEDFGEWRSIAKTWTYASASTFTVSGNYVGVFTKDARLRFVQSSTTKYAVVVSATFSAPNTTVTILVNSDYTIANAAITDTFVSYSMSPAGYPRNFNFTPTYNNVTVGNGTRAGKVSVNDGHVEGWASFDWAATTDTPTSAFTGSVSLVPPVTESTDVPSRLVVGGASMFDSSVPSVFNGECTLTSGNIELRANNASATHETIVNVTGAIPMSWAGSDNFRMTFRYPYG